MSESITTSEGDWNPDTRVSIPRQPQSALTPSQGTPLTGCPTNIDITTFAGKAALLRAASPGTIKLVGGNPVRIKAVHYALIPESRVDEQTGELREYVTLALIDSKGESFRTTAAHAPMALQRLLSMFTPDEWRQGIPLVVTERPPSRKGRTPWHDIQLDTSAD